MTSYVVRVDVAKIVPWEDERCRHNEGVHRCTGIRLSDDNNCLAHASADQRNQALSTLAAGADLDFTRGVPVSETLLIRILEQAPQADGSPIIRNADFTLATFEGDPSPNGEGITGPSFAGVRFDGDARFERATFSGTAWFNGATFSGQAWFYEATFIGSASFDRATFSDIAVFHRAGFSRVAWFDELTFPAGVGFRQTTFSGAASFRRTTFSEVAAFEGAKFSGDARFHEATFSGDARFHQAMFSGDARFHQTTFFGEARFDGSTFEKTRIFGPALILGGIVFDGALFSENVDIEVSSNGLSCQRSKFRDGATLKIRWALVTLDDADFSRPCLLTWNSESKHVLEIVLPDLLFVSQAEPLPESKPRIASLRRANVGGLTVSAVDLAACRFAGAHNLDQLRIDSKRQIAERPRGWYRQLGWPPLWRWTVRRALAEEHEWRHRHERGIKQEGWYPQVCQPPPPANTNPLSAADIQNIYRSLRKGREDSKDEPGAADFYYGEMEMRRAATRLSFEKFVLWFYWLVSGYGLRASRALFALLVTVLFCSVAIDLWGVPRSDERDFVETLVFGLQSTTSLLRAPDATLTLSGQVIQIALRLLGPLFFGLALLSLRGRVKR